MRTYQAHLAVNEQQSHLLEAFAVLHNHVERCLFAETIDKGIKPEHVKSAYLVRFGITARQFNAIGANLKGKVASIKELRKRHIKERAEKIKQAQKTIVKITRLIKNIEDARNKGHKANPTKLKRLKFSLHQKKRRLYRLEGIQARHVADDNSGKVRLCFGSNALFKKQFHLAANQYASHEEWQRDWQQARNNQFYVLGSKDETAGCQGCVATKTEQGFQLRLRLPEALISDGVKYLTFDIALAYGHQVIMDALENKQAISYRFLRDDKGWRVFISTDVNAKPVTTSLAIGAIGVDINEQHLAVTDVDRFGNPVATINIPLSTYGKSTEQSDAVIGDAIKSLMAFAKGKQKPIVIEALDFQKKKQSLSKDSPKRARQLSSFAYGKIINTLKARCVDHAIECIEKNPAYTSIIGACKFMRRYGMTSHQAAACAIARRGLNLSERPNRRDPLASVLPEWKTHEHVGSFWRAAARKKEVREALLSLRKPQSSRQTTDTLPTSAPVTLLHDNMAERVRHSSQEHCSLGEAIHG